MAEGSGFTTATGAPAARATWANPAAGYTVAEVPITRRI
jgi:hypothetical protein